MPITITIPTQQQLAAMQNDPNSLLAMYQAAQTPKPTSFGASATNTAGIAPGSTTASPTMVSPVAALPAFTPQVHTVTAPAPFQWQPIATPATPQNNNEWIKATADMINQINQQAQVNANAARIPGGRGLESQSSINIGSALKGNLPADVVNQIAQRSAERGVSTGNPYGAGTNADYLRAIGLNSLQLQNTGQDWLSAALARNPSAPIFDSSKLVMTPLQQAEYALAAANFGVNQQQAQFGAYNANAQQNLQASLANASNATDADRLTLATRQQELERQNQNAQRQLQSDLANADTQFKRDQLIWQYQQNQLNRENALRIAQMETAARAAGYGRNAGGGGSSPYGGFNPATNWTGGGTNTFTTPWNDPGNPSNPYAYNNQMFQEDINNIYPDYNGLYQGGETTGAGMATGNPGAYYANPLDYGSNINTTGMTQDELDWLYNVGG